MKLTDIDVYFVSFCRMSLIIFTAVTFSTGCSGSVGSTGMGSSIDLDAMSSANGIGFVAVAGENIFSSTGSIHIDTSSTTGDGGNVILVAGASSEEGAKSTVIGGRSGTGGDVDLGNLNSITIDTRSYAPGHSGGSVTIVAFAQSPGSSVGGHIRLPPQLTILTGGSGTGASGKIILVGEARSNSAWPVTVETGALNTTGSQNAAMIVIETATPSTSSPVTIRGGYATPQQPLNGTVVSGMFQFGTVQEGAVRTGALTAAGSGGSVLVMAGSNTAFEPAISTQDILTSSSNGSGRVLLMAGAATPQNEANCFDIVTGDIDTHSTSKQPGFPVTVVTPGAINSGSIDTSCSSADRNYGGSGEVTMTAGSYYKPDAGITVRGGIDSSVQSAYSLGSATITLIGMGTASDISIINPGGPAINATANGPAGGGGGAGALLISTPGKITLENNSGSGDVVDTYGFPALSGSQVVLSSGVRTGTAISILSNGSPGIIDTRGGQLGYGNVWVLTAGGDYTDYTAVGDPSPNNFTDLGQSQDVIGPGTDLTITFIPGQSPAGYCPGGYTSISDSLSQPTRINIDSTGNNEQLEVPVLVTGRAGIALNNPGSFIESTHVSSSGSTPYYAVMKLFSSGPIAAPLANGTSGQLFGVTGLVSTTGDVAVSALSPVSLYNLALTPGTLTVSSLASQAVGSDTPAVTNYGAMVAGDSINLNSTLSVGNSDIVLSPALPALSTLWEYCIIAGTINISAGGSGSINSYGQLYCNKLSLNSETGQISIAPGQISADSPVDLNVEAAKIQFSTDGAVSVRDAWPVILKTSNGNAIQIVEDSSFVTIDKGSLVAGLSSIEFMSPTAGGPVNVTNNGQLKTTGASSIIGFNSSGQLTVDGKGYINTWQLNIGNLDAATLAILQPYVAVSPPGNCSLGNISISGQDIISGIMYVSIP